MTYTGKVENGVVIFEGSARPADGARVRVDEISGNSDNAVGEELDQLAGKANGLPSDLAARHDEHRRQRRAS